MKKEKSKKLIVTSGYAEFLHSIKSRIQGARIVAARAVSKELISLYWSIGKDIVEKQKQLGWGKSVVEQLSKDLKDEFPGTDGFSARNLWDMRRFYEEYQIDTNLRQLVAEIPWGHNLLVLNMVKDQKAREYYLKASAEMGWSRNVLRYPFNLSLPGR